MSTAQSNQYVIGIRTPTGKLVRAFDMTIKGQDVYANYSDISTPSAHKSYHESGQQHTKVGREYVKWSGGYSGEMEPMIFHRTPPGAVCEREDCWVVGWYIHKLDRILPALNEPAAMMVDAEKLDLALVLGFKVWVIGDEATPQQNILGFPIIARQVFGTAPRIEVNAFLVQEEEEPSMAPTNRDLGNRV